MTRPPPAGCSAAFAGRRTPCPPATDRRGRGRRRRLLRLRLPLRPPRAERPRRPQPRLGRPRPRRSRLTRPRTPRWRPTSAPRPAERRPRHFATGSRAVAVAVRPGRRRRRGESGAGECSRSSPPSSGSCSSGFWSRCSSPSPGDGLGDGRVAVDIPADASASEVADLLADKGVVSNATLFKIRLKLSGKDGELVTGPLAMASGMSYSAAIDRLTGESSEAGRLVIPEGDSRDQIAPLVADAGIEGTTSPIRRATKGSTRPSTGQRRRRKPRRLPLPGDL